jgi:hypothetical protein
MIIAFAVMDAAPTKTEVVVPASGATLNTPPTAIWGVTVAVVWLANWKQKPPDVFAYVNALGQHTDADSSAASGTW